jgi:serine/threonine protein kinase/tetratricopeptide (TPR) repeat protein
MSADLQELGPYRIVRPVGRGGMGVVFEAVHTGLDKRVALKVLTHGLVAGRLDRFLREARTAAGLHHTNVVPVFDAGQVGGTAYYAMQFIDGTPLDAFLKPDPGPTGSLSPAGPTTRTSPPESAPTATLGSPGGATATRDPRAGDHSAARSKNADEPTRARLGPRRVAEWGLQAAEGLAYAHERGVVHRDVKPSNLLLDAAGVVWVADFGLAFRADDPTLTGEGEILGTPRYMSPEQAAAERTDARTDVYSLGVTLYELLTGAPAFSGGGPMDVIHKVLTHTPPRPRSLNRRVPRDLETVVKAMARAPADRYPSGREMADDLKRFLAGEPVKARRIGVVGRAWRWGRRNPAVAALLSALLLALAGGTAASTALWLRARANYREASVQRERADENFREALQAVDDYYTKVTENQLLDSKLPGMQPLRKELLEAALRYYQRFAERHADDPGLRLELAKAYGRIGRVTAEIGSQEEGLQLLLKSRDLLLALDRDRPGDEAVLEPLAAAYHQLGFVQNRTGRATEAVESARLAVARVRELLAAAPADAGRRELMARACAGLGNALDKANRPDEALRAFREGIELVESLARDCPGEARYLHSLAGQHHNVGVVYQDTLGKPREARAAFRTALELEEQAAARAPYDVRVQDFMAKHLHSLGVVHDNLKEFAPALEFFERAVALREKLVRENPAVHEFRGELAFSYRALGRLRRVRGEREPAARAFDQALALLERLVLEQPASPEYRRILGLTYTSLGVLRFESGDLAESLGYRRQAVAIQEKLVRDHPDNLHYRGHLVLYLGNLGTLSNALDLLDDTRRTVERAQPLIDELRGRGYQEPYFAGAPARHQTLSTQVRQQIATAEEELRRAREAANDERARLPAAPGVPARVRLLGLLSGCFLHEWRLGRKEEALRSMEESLRLVEGLIAERPDELEYRRIRVSCHVHGARARRDLGRPEEALRAARTALAAWDPRLAERPERLVELAGARALCAALVGEGRTELTEAEAAERRRLEDQAVEALHTAVAKGFRDVRVLKCDFDLDPLRRREDFGALVRDLEGKPAGNVTGRPADSGDKK